MHKHVGKHAKMQRSEESQMGAQSKQGKHIITQSGEMYALSKPTSQRYISQAITSQ